MGTTQLSYNNDDFFPTIIIGLGDSGKKIIESVYRNISLDASALSILSFVSIYSKNNSNEKNNMGTGKIPISQIELVSSKTSRGKILEDYRRSDIPNILRDSIVSNFDKSGSNSQIILAASLGELEASLIGDTLYRLRVDSALQNFTVYLCLSINSSSSGNQIRNEEIYAGLREISRLGTYGYHIMGLPNEKINIKRVYDYLFIFEDEKNQKDRYAPNDPFPNAIPSMGLFIVNLINKNNYLIHQNLLQSMQNSIEKKNNNQKFLGNCLSTSLRTISSPNSRIKRIIAIELLIYKLMNEEDGSESISRNSLNVNWNQISMELADWFNADHLPKTAELSSLIFKNNEKEIELNLDSDLRNYIKSFRSCVHQGVRNSLAKNVNRDSFNFVDNAIHLIIDRIENQIGSARLNYSQNSSDELFLRLLQELLKESQDIAREIGEWKVLFNSPGKTRFTHLNENRSDKFLDILQSELAIAKDNLFLLNPIQINAANNNEIEIYINNFLRNSMNGSQDAGRLLIESLNQYISVRCNSDASFQIQLTTGVNPEEKKYYEPDQIPFFIQDCLCYLESNLNIEPFKLESIRPDLIEHLNNAMMINCHFVQDSMTKNHLQHSSYLISGFLKDADGTIASVFSDTSSANRHSIIDKKKENEICANRIFYNVPIDEIEAVDKFSEDYYPDSALYIFPQEKNAIRIEKKLKNFGRYAGKILLPSEVVELLYDMDLVSKFLRSTILGVLITDSDSDDTLTWKFKVPKTGRYFDPVICEAGNGGLKDIYQALKAFALELPNNDACRTEKAGHFFYHENRPIFLEDLQNEIDRKTAESDLKKTCGEFWNRVHKTKNGVSSIEAGMESLFIYEMLELLHSVYDLKEIIGNGEKNGHG